MTKWKGYDGKFRPNALGLDRPHYKHEVRLALAALDPAITLPVGVHPLWEVIERCWEADKTTYECAMLIIRLHTLITEGMK